MLSIMIGITKTSINEVMKPFNEIPMAVAKPEGSIPRKLLGPIKNTQKI